MLTGHTILLDRERVVRFDAVAQIELERTSGMSIFNIMRQLVAIAKGEDLSLHLMMCMLHAGLRHELHGVTPEQVAELVEQHGRGDTIIEKFSHYAPQCLAALYDALPKAKT